MKFTLSKAWMIFLIVSSLIVVIPVGIIIIDEAIIYGIGSIYAFIYKESTLPLYQNEFNAIQYSTNILLFQIGLLIYYKTIKLKFEILGTFLIVLSSSSLFYNLFTELLITNGYRITFLIYNLVIGLILILLEIIKEKVYK